MIPFQREQESIEVMNYTNAFSEAMSKIFEHAAKGTEYHTKYGKEAIEATIPMVYGTLVSFISEGLDNDFWNMTVLPAITSNKKFGGRKVGDKVVGGIKLADHIAQVTSLNLISTFSKKAKILSVCRTIADTLLNIIDISYEDRTIELNFSAIDFVYSLIMKLDPKGDVFDINQDLNGNYYISHATHWNDKITEARTLTRVKSFCFVPMVCKPKKHSKLVGGDGGLYTVKSPLLKRPTRINGKIHPELLKFKDKAFFDQINRTQETPYEVNVKLLDVITSLSKKCLYFRKFPTTLKRAQRNADLESSIEIKELSKRFTTIYPNKIKEIKDLSSSNWQEKFRKTEDITYLAEEYTNYPCFYYNIYLDDRGRRYTYVPTSSFTYMGNELAKALINFNNKEVITEEGLEALYETLGNCIKWDKCSVEMKREKAKEWYKAREEMFNKGYFNMFVKKQHKFEEPINALAVVLELIEYYKDPKNYKSGYMCHRDARCSGVSITSTLLNDFQGMYYTSVVDEVMSNKMKLPDAYQYVADRARELNKTSEYGSAYFEENNSTLFARSVWKPPVMTRGAYGCSKSTIHSGSSDSPGGNLKVFLDAKLDLSQLGNFTELMMETLDHSLPSCSKYLNAIRSAAGKFVEENDFLLVKNFHNGFPIVRRKTISTKTKLSSPNKNRPIELVIYKHSDVINLEEMTNAYGADLIHQFDAGLLFRVQEQCNFDISTIHDSIAATPSQIHKVVSAYNVAMHELATKGAIADLFTQLGSPELTPFVGDVSKEQLDSILVSRHSLT